MFYYCLTALAMRKEKENSPRSFVRKYFDLSIKCYRQDGRKRTFFPRNVVFAYGPVAEQTAVFIYIYKYILEPVRMCAHAASSLMASCQKHLIALHLGSTLSETASSAQPPPPFLLRIPRYHRLCRRRLLIPRCFSPIPAKKMLT